MKELRVLKVWLDDLNIYAETENGFRAVYAFADWQRLAEATEEQRKDFYLTYYGIHWPQVDEDLSFEGMFLDNHLVDGSCQVYYA